MADSFQTFDGRFFLLLAVIVIGGIVAILSTWTLLNQKAFVNEQGDVTEVEVPFFGKMKTTYPAVVVSLFGIALVAFGATHLPDETGIELPRLGALPAEIAPDPSGTVMQYIVTVADQSQWFPVSPGFDEPVSITVPVELGRNYNLIVAKMLPDRDANGFPRYQMSITPVGLIDDFEKIE